MSAEKNKQINNALSQLYHENTEAFLSEWKKHYGNDGAPDRINEFGIVDPDTYDPENGILFIAKETNGWDFSEGITFIPWLFGIARSCDFPESGIARKHPQVWYNIARWTKLILDPYTDQAALVKEKKKSLSSLKSIAFTNVSKVGGANSSRKAFWSLVESMNNENSIVLEILKKEIEIISPKYIVLCGMKESYILKNIKTDAKILEMPHPSSRNVSKEMMLAILEKQLKA